MKIPKGFSTVSVVIVAVILILIGFAGWYVWQKQNTDLNKQNNAKTTADQTKRPTPPLELVTSKLPKDWTAQMNVDGAVAVSDAKTSCSTIVKYTTDTTVSNPADADSTQALVNGLKAKGNTVTQTGTKLTVLTPDGQKQTDATQLQVTGPNASEQYFAAVSRKGSYTEIQLSCPNKKDLPTAQAALLAIRLNKF